MSKKKYFTEEERKAARKEYMAKYYQDNKEKINRMNVEWKKNNPTYQTEYYQAHKEVEKDKAINRYYSNKDTILEQKLNKRSTPLGRASELINNYVRHDKKAKRGECTLTPKWIVENIFSQPCHYCGETDWRKLGCDRIDNDKPHTLENVVPCCTKCNINKGKKEYNEFIKIIKSNT